MAARFEVKHIFEVTDRGRVVAGTIRSGEFRIGQRVTAEHEPSLAFTIAAIDYVDTVSTRESFVAFVLTDAPALSKLLEVLPAGAFLVDPPPVAGPPEVPHVA
jgi:hypothetical protein